MGPAIDPAHLAAECNDRMPLFRDTATAIMPGMNLVNLEAWYWQCPTCGLVLSAVRAPR
jgi:hypothetical protein